MIQYIADIEQACIALKGLVSESEIGLDIETTGLDPILDSIRLVQIATPLKTYVIDMYHVPTSVLNPLLTGGPIKVIHNSKFDAGFFYQAPDEIGRAHV